MSRVFESDEIIKLLNVMIGETEAIGDTYEDERRLDNLIVLIDITNWCLDELQFAMMSGINKFEYSMFEIGHTAQSTLYEYETWITDILRRN